MAYVFPLYTAKARPALVWCHIAEGLPHGLRDRDALIPQYLNNLKVSCNRIRLPPMAQKLLDYGRKHDPYLPDVRSSN